MYVNETPIKFSDGTAVESLQKKKILLNIWSEKTKASRQK